jgi:hypothetical protein
MSPEHVRVRYTVDTGRVDGPSATGTLDVAYTPRPCETRDETISRIIAVALYASPDPWVFVSFDEVPTVA